MNFAQFSFVNGISIHPYTSSQLIFSFLCALDELRQLCCVNLYAFLAAIYNTSSRCHGFVFIFIISILLSNHDSYVIIGNLMTSLKFGC